MGLRSGALLLLGVVGVLGLRLVLGLHGGVGDEQAGVDTKSVLLLLQGDSPSAWFSISGLPNLKIPSGLGLLLTYIGIKSPIIS